MKVIPTELPGVSIIEPKVFSDDRGFFLESYHAERYSEFGINLPFVQDNLSRSKKGVLRGLHYQQHHLQGKLVWVTHGTIFDVAVDVRYGSPNFGKSVGVILDDEQHQQLYIPPGFAHGFYALSETVDFYYKCTDFYHPTAEMGLNWNDPDLDIQWPLIGTPILVPRDAAYPRLKDIPKENLPHYA